MTNNKLKEPLNIAITGAAGQIAYSFLSLLGNYQIIKFFFENIYLF